MVGIDLMEVDRIDFSDEFMNKIATPDEIEYIKKSKCENLQKQRLTALFCVKEAVSKALGTGIRKGVKFKDIVLNHEESGKPFVKLYGKAEEILKAEFKGKEINISISHTEKYATAIAVVK